VVIYGRRRIGISELIDLFINNRNNRLLAREESKTLQPAPLEALQCGRRPRLLVGVVGALPWLLKYIVYEIILTADKHR